MLIDNGACSVLNALQDNFFAAWSRGQWHYLTPNLAEDAILTSSQHGEGLGATEWRRLLAGDTVALTWMHTSNHAILVGKSGQAASSAYVIGMFGSGPQQFLFGAGVVLRFQSHDPEGQWSLFDARIQVNWCKGDPSLAAHWRKPPSDAGWQLGDEPPVIVSELDSPWAFIGDALPQASAQDAVRQLFSQYSWAIDQGDISLLSDSYTDDAVGGFAPMGQLEGRHAIIGQQKSFRRLWPWMQHFADVLRVEIEADSHHARMIVARIVPERPVDEAGRSLYGAHYQLRLRLEGDGKWRICWFDYRPGWFTNAEIPAFDIGVIHA